MPITGLFLYNRAINVPKSLWPETKLFVPSIGSITHKKSESEFIFSNSIKGALIILDDYGGWFTDGVTEFGNELKNNEECFVVPNHLGQLLIYKI